MTELVIQQNETGLAVSVRTFPRRGTGCLVTLN